MKENKLLTVEDLKEIARIEEERVMELFRLFMRSDQRGQDLLLAMAKIHAERYPAEGK